jgi:hypothetical protein
MSAWGSRDLSRSGKAACPTFKMGLCMARRCNQSPSSALIGLCLATHLLRHRKAAAIANHSGINQTASIRKRRRSSPNADGAPVDASLFRACGPRRGGCSSKLSFWTSEIGQASSAMVSRATPFPTSSCLQPISSLLVLPHEMYQRFAK